MIIEYSLEDCLIGHSYEVTALASNGNRYLVSGSKDCTIKVWIVKDNNGKTTLYKTLVGHSSIVQDVAITKDDKYIVSGSWDGNVCIWDIESGECIKTIKHQSQIMKVSYIPQENGDFISSITNDGTVMIWKLFFKKRKQEEENEENEEEPKFYKSYHTKGTFNTCCAFSTSPEINPILCTSGSDGKIFSCFDEFINGNSLSMELNNNNNNNNIDNNNNANNNENKNINNNNNKIVKYWKHESDGIINYLLFSPANFYIGSGCSEGILCLRGINDSKVFIKLNCGNPINCFSFNPLRYMCSTANDKNVIIWDLETKEILTTIIIDDFDDQLDNDENKEEIISKFRSFRDKEYYKTQLKDKENRDKKLIQSLSTCWYSNSILFVSCSDNTIRKYEIRYIEIDY
ncbi:hypothetical protein ACTA71_002573 [Dictyostelium dimigraforme]